MGRNTAGPKTHWGLTVTGIGEVKAGQVWYSALLDLSDYPTMQELRNGIVDSCEAHYLSADLTPNDLLNCVTSVDAVGFWTADEGQNVTANTGVSVETVSKLSYPYEEVLLFHKRVDNTWLNVSTRVCQHFPFYCNWQNPTKIADTTDAPASAVRPGVPPFIRDTVYVCYRSVSGTLNCKRRIGSPWQDGPHPNVQIEGAPSMAYWNGLIWIAYRKADGYIYLKTLGASTWSQEYSTGIDGPHPPSLASAAEDPHAGSDNRLWLVYRHGTSLRYSWYSLVEDSFVSSLPVGQVDQQNQTIANIGPTAAMFRGRLHVASNHDPAIWYASCEMPCDQPSHWTRIVEQTGSAMAPMHLEATSDANRLTLWHLLSDTAGYSYLQQRSKRSE